MEFICTAGCKVTTYGCRFVALFLKIMNIFMNYNLKILISYISSSMLWARKPGVASE